MELFEGLWQDLTSATCSSFYATSPTELNFRQFSTDEACTLTFDPTSAIKPMTGSVTCGQTTNDVDVALEKNGIFVVTLHDNDAEANRTRIVLKQCAFDSSSLLGDTYLYSSGNGQPEKVVRAFDSQTVDDSGRLVYSFTYRKNGKDVTEEFYVDDTNELNSGRRIIGDDVYTFIYWAHPDGSFYLAIQNQANSDVEPVFDPNEPGVTIEQYGRKPGEPDAGRYSYAINFATASGEEGFQCHERTSGDSTQDTTSYSYLWNGRQCTETYEKFTGRGRLTCTRSSEDTTQVTYPFVYSQELDGSFSFVTSTREYSPTDPNLIYPNRYATNSRLNARYTLYPCTVGYALRGSWRIQEAEDDPCVHMIPVFDKTISIVEASSQMMFASDNSGSYQDDLCPESKPCGFTSSFGPRTFTIRVSADESLPPPIDQPKRETDRDITYIRCQFTVFDALFGTFLDVNNRRVVMSSTGTPKERSFVDSDGLKYKEDVSKAYETGVIVRTLDTTTPTAPMYYGALFGADGSLFGVEAESAQVAQELVSGFVDTRIQAESGKHIFFYSRFFDGTPLYRGEFLHNAYDMCVTHTPKQRDQDAVWNDPTPNGNGMCRVTISPDYNGGTIKCDKNILDEFVVFTRDLYTGAYYVAHGPSLGAVTLEASHSLQLWKPCPTSPTLLFTGAIRAPVVFGNEDLINFDTYDRDWGELLSPSLPDADITPCQVWTQKDTPNTKGFTVNGVNDAGEPCEYTFGLKDGAGTTTCKFSTLNIQGTSQFYYQVTGLGLITITIDFNDPQNLPAFRGISDTTVTVVLSRCLPPKPADVPVALATGVAPPYQASSVARFIGQPLAVQVDILDMATVFVDAIGVAPSDTSSQNRFVVQSLKDDSILLDVSLMPNGVAIDNTDPNASDISNGYWSIDHTETLFITLGAVDYVTTSQSSKGESYIIRRRLQQSFPLSNNSKWALAGSTSPDECKTYKVISTSTGSTVYGSTEGGVNYFNVWNGVLPGFGTLQQGDFENPDSEFAMAYYFDDAGAFVVRRNGNPLYLDPSYPAPQYDPNTIPDALKGDFIRFVRCVPVVHVSYLVGEKTDFALTDTINQQRLLSQIQAAVAKQATPSIPAPAFDAYGQYSVSLVPNSSPATYNVSFAVDFVKVGASAAVDVVNMFKHIDASAIPDFNLDAASFESYVDDTLQPVPPPNPTPSGGSSGLSLTGTVIVTVVCAFASMAIAFVGIRMYYGNAATRFAGFVDVPSSGSGLASQSQHAVNYDSV